MNGLRVALVGMPASGKTEATHILKEAYRFDSYRLSNVVRDELRDRKLADTYDNLENVARDLRARYGEDIVVRRAAERVKSIDAQYCCIDGVRSLAEIDALREFLPDLVVVAIHASSALRLKRTKRVSPSLQMNEFRWRDKQNLELGLGHAIALADFVVVHNDNSRSRFQRDLSRILRRVCRLNNQPWPPP